MAQYSRREERQAREVVEFYKTLFAHPLVEGITWWDLLDGQWLKAPSGLIREDYSQTSLWRVTEFNQKEWWTEDISLVTDQEGQVEFTGFLGEYEIAFGDKKANFSLKDKAEKEISIYL